MKKIYKYPTGAEVPEGSVFLSTIVEEVIPTLIMGGFGQENVRLVWHYFLVEVKK